MEQTETPPAELAPAELAPTDPSPPDPSPEAPPPGPQPDEGPTECLNCGAERLGAYCQRCGQHHLDDRLTLRVVWREFAERFLKLERGLLATLKLALLDPGALARRYVGGERRRFVNPISFLLIGSAIAVLMIPLYASQDRIVNDTSMPTVAQDSTARAAQFDLGVRLAGGDPSELSADERAEAIQRSVEAQEEFLPLYLSTMQQLYSVFSIVLALALAGWFKLFFAGRTPSYTFAETLVAGCYVAGIYLLLSATIASLLAPFAPILGGTIVSALLLLGLAALAARGFYERTAGAAALGALSGALALVAYMVTVVVVAIPVVIVKMIRT